jgi:pimeloyl-ACP methyl ester carboxylesterase
MRCSRLSALLFALLVASQPSVTRAVPLHSPHMHSHPRQRVYLLRGFMNVFSLGMDQIAADLQRRGIDAVVGNYSQAGEYADEAIKECKAGRISSIAIVGHSFGASAAVEMANQLAQAGVKVGLVVTVDPVNPTVVSGNVRTLKNFYISTGIGKPVEPATDFHGSLQNIDMKADPNEDHVSLQNSVRLHKEVVGYVRTAVGSKCR